MGSKRVREVGRRGRVIPSQKADAACDRNGTRATLAFLHSDASLKLVREAFHGLMEDVPLHLSLEEIGKATVRVEGVSSVHDLHIWSLTAERLALSAHVAIARFEC